MSNLILPISGKSSRFPNLRPKWMLTHPNGNFMLIEAIKGLNLKKFKTLYIIALKKQLDEFKFKDGLENQLHNIGIKNFKIIILEKETESQAETVYEGIKKGKINGSICIKDCDNFFNIETEDINFISTENLSSFKSINAANKSYIKINELGNIINIAEKQIISDSFCTGCYGFQCSNDFIKYFEILKNKKDLYISHIIYRMILDNYIFKTIKCNNYIDWGTKKDWDDYKSQYKTIFIDLDGVLVKNSSEHFNPKWGETEIIKENVELIRNLYSSGKAHIIITTSRKSYLKKQIIKELKQKDIPYHKLILDLFHAKRFLINDFSDTNKYPSCEAINLIRDNNNLNKYIN
jgi:hypothetical protein